MGSISVIVPCKNECAILPLTLGALVREAAHGAIAEILLVDNNSTDDSVQAAVHIGVSVQSCTGTISLVRNHGARNTNGSTIAFVDADVEVTDGWSLEVSRFLDNHSNPDAIIIGETYGLRERCSWVERVWHKSLTSRARQAYINGGNLAMTRTCFMRLGGFDSTHVTGEDVELCRRARAMGINVEIVPEMKTIHHGYPTDLVSFYRRERWHGLGMAKDIFAPWRSRSLIMAYGMLILPLALLLSVNLWGWWALSAFPFLAFACCARRLRRECMIDRLCLVLLINVYGFARAHALVLILMDRLVGAFNVRTRIR
jgi:glycosyltransferase involved in cell wall biosynthesis